MEYLILYVVATLGISVIHKFRCKGDTSQDGQLQRIYGVKGWGFEALLILVGAITWPWTLYDICTWHRENDETDS